MESEPLQLFLRYFSFALIPLSLAEGYWLTRLSGRRITFSLGAFGAAVFDAWLYVCLLTGLPEWISDAGWRFIPDFYIDNTLYLLLSLFAAFGMKAALFMGYGKFRGMTRSELRKPFWLTFAIFDLSTLLIAGALGYGNTWNYSYDVARSFANGIDYYAVPEPGKAALVSQRDYLGKSFDVSVTPFPVKPLETTIFYLGGTPSEHPVTSVPWGIGPQTTASGVVVRSNPAGGLRLDRPNGKTVLLNYQTLLHRWRPALFSVIPGTDCILLSVRRRNYLYDAARNNLYDLAFSRGRIAAFGIRLTPEASAKTMAEIQAAATAAATATAAAREP